MSTGIGLHEFSFKGEGSYNPPKAICPYCGQEDLEAEWVDVGIGLVQCGPYYCHACRASEASSLDTREMTDREKETGWYEPDTPISENAPQLNGVPIGEKEAMSLYRSGYNPVPSSKKDDSGPF